MMNSQFKIIPEKKIDDLMRFVWGVFDESKRPMLRNVFRKILLSRKKIIIDNGGKIQCRVISPQLYVKFQELFEVAKIEKNKGVPD